MRYVRVALSMLLALMTALVISASAAAEATPQITVTKKVTDDYIKPGGTIHYRYEVTANDRFTGSTIVVTDNKCSPVTPTLGGGPGGAYNIGDTADFGYLNGFLGEKWIFTCNATAPAVNPAQDLTNTATVVGNIAYDGFTQFSDTDSFTLEAVVLRKHVVLYWDFVHEIVAPGTGDVAFPVDLYKNSVKVGTESVSANTPLSLWLTPGSWNLTEGTPPAGYTVLRGTWNLTVPDAYADNTFFDAAQFDLAIDKTGPDFAYNGDSVTYTYTVTNTGPGLVTPEVTDNLCAPVNYVSGDTNGNNKIESSETWTFTCTYTPNWVFPGPLTNTATVADANKPSGAPWNLGNLMGGDTNAANNTDSYSLYPFVLRKEVGLYNDGAYPDFGAFTDNTVFNVHAYKGGVLKTNFTISENSPKQMWLGAGTWTFQEYDLPLGYIAFYPNATITFVTGSYPDWTQLNVTWSGCSHGYWKNHTDDWNAPYTTASLLIDVFGPNALAGDFEDALAFPGGPGLEGGKQILLRQAVAALLNEAEYGSAFGPYSSTGALISAVTSALGSGNRGTMLSLASTLDYWNNGVCR